MNTTTSWSAPVRPGVCWPIDCRPTRTMPRAAARSRRPRQLCLDSHSCRLPVLHRQPAHRLVLQDRGATGLQGRGLSYPRGKVLGGCSSINGMIYMRGQAGDYDRWAARRQSRLGWHDVLPLFKKSENHFAGDSEHSMAPPVNGGSSASACQWPILDAFRSAAEQSGIASIDDFNQGDNEGCGYFQVNQKAGVRWNAAKAFLKPVRDRPNLTVLTDVEVDRVLLENGRASAVKTRCSGQAEDVQGCARRSFCVPGPSARRASCNAPVSARASCWKDLGIGVRHELARRRRQSAGSPAIAPDLQTGKRSHPEPDRRQRVGQDGHGPALPVRPQRATVHGAEPVGRVRALRPGADVGQS